MNNPNPSMMYTPVVMAPLTRLLFLELVFDNFFRFVLNVLFVVVIGLLAVSFLLGVIVIQRGIVILNSDDCLRDCSTILHGGYTEPYPA